MEEKMKKFEDRQELHHRVLFGDKETGELGIHEMTKEMYDIITSINNVTSFFGGIGTLFKWLLLIGAGFTALKIWGATLLAYLLSIK